MSNLHRGFLSSSHLAERSDDAVHHLESLEPRVLLTAVTVGIDWNQSVANTTAESFGVNAWGGTEAAVANNSAYKANMAQLSPGLTRIHAFEVINSSASHAKGWVNTSTKKWDASRIDSVLDGLNTTTSEIMMNIGVWPSWMDTNNDNRLDADKIDDYAAWSASLVQIANIQHGHGIKYWEVTNELDLKSSYYIDNPGAWADIFNQAAAAMRAVDPSIKVGGVAYANPWRPTMGALVSAIAPNADFFTYHHYENGSAATPDADVYEGAREIGDSVRYVRDILDNNGAKGKPLGLTEYNISWTFDTFDARMTNHKGAVFDALLMKYAAEAGAWTVQAWNDRDGVYGKMDNSYNIRLPGRMQALANDHLIGEVAKITSLTDRTLVDAFAVASPTGKSIVLINRSNSAHTVDTTFAGNWTPSNTTAQVHKIQSSGYTTSTGSFAAVTNDLAIAAHSVVILTFNDATSAPIQREAIADTFVESANPTKTNGSASVLNSYNADNSTHTYLKFDIANLGSVSNAKLRFIGKSSYGEANMNLHAVASNAWTEAGMTWNNKPASGALLATIDVIDSNIRRYEVDLTSHVQAAIAAGQTQLSLRLSNVPWGYITNQIESRDSVYQGPTLLVKTSAQTINAAADAYVNNKTPTTNYGSATEMQLYYAWETYRNGYINFNLANVPANQTFKIRLNAKTTDGSALNLRVVGVTSGSWTESGLNWNNRPTAGTTLATTAINGTTKQWYEIDVTAFVQQRIAAGATSVSFRLENATWGYQTIQIDSRETAFGPQLLIG